MKKPDIDELVARFRHQISEVVVTPGYWAQESEKQCRNMLAFYGAAVRLNFTNWIGIALIDTRNEFARYALADNLRCETQQDHVGMLDRFLESSHVEIERVHYGRVADSLKMIRSLFRNKNTAGLVGLTVMAPLETASIDFIPCLAAAAEKLGCKDFEYPNVHGEADTEHSTAFLKAFKAEIDMGYSEKDMEIVEETYGALVLFIRAIFR